jgi:heme/copper-type cytochrome/quinol oxidase subunit 2
MKGRITVESRKDYERWLDEMMARQEATQPEPAEQDAVAAAD